MFSRFEKNQRHRWVGGVASGLARFAGFDSFPARMLVRFVFLAFPPVSFFIYMLLWAVMPTQRLYDRNDLAEVVSETVRQVNGKTVTVETPASQPSPARPGSLKAALDDLVARISGKVTPDVLEKVLSIRASILTVAPQLDRLRGSKDAYNLKRTALEYLPDALDTYLGLPRQYAETQILSNGETAHDTLVAQLELLDTTMTRIMADAYQEDADALLVHGRFLEEKFSSKAFNLPPQSATAAPQQLPQDTGATRFDSVQPVKQTSKVKV